MFEKHSIYLRGAYGPGNLGDDILMLLNIKLLQRAFPNEKITVGVEDISLAAKIDPIVNWVQYKRPFKSKLTVLGGGGQFFDFQDSTKQYTATDLRGLIGRLKKQSSVASALKRSLFCRGPEWHDRLYKTDSYSAFCIGLGPFHGEGAGLARAKRFLRAVDYVSVRDARSAELVQELASRNVSAFADPTLDPELWYASPTAARPKLGSENSFISLIVRDWPHDSYGNLMTGRVLLAAEKMKEMGHKVRLVSLHDSRESHIREQNYKFDWLTWKVGECTPAEFVRRLINESSAIVSTRAHGVLLPASLGVPSVCVRIEEKLLEVNRMLGGVLPIIDKPDEDAIVRASLDMAERAEVYAEALSLAHEARVRLVHAAVAEYMEFLESVSLV